jgi:hypothetical protein
LKSFKLLRAEAGNVPNDPADETWRILYLVTRFYASMHRINLHIVRALSFTFGCKTINLMDNAPPVMQIGKKDVDKYRLE